jgi:hypothetical protein
VALGVVHRPDAYSASVPSLVGGAHLLGDFHSVDPGNTSTKIKVAHYPNFRSFYAFGGP